MVFPPLGRLAIEVIVDLSVQNTLRQRLLQLVEKAVLVENLLRIAAVQKVIQCLFLDCHMRPPSASLWPRTQEFLTVPGGDAEAGRKALQAFEDGSWGRKYAAAKSGGDNWSRSSQRLTNNVHPSPTWRPRPIPASMRILSLICGEKPHKRPSKLIGACWLPRRSRARPYGLLMGAGITRP